MVTIGLSDVIIVDTPDALLVCRPRSGGGDQASARRDQPQGRRPLPLSDAAGRPLRLAGADVRAVLALYVRLVAANLPGLRLRSAPRAGRARLLARVQPGRAFRLDEGPAGPAARLVLDAAASAASSITTLLTADALDDPRRCRCRRDRSRRGARLSRCAWRAWRRDGDSLVVTPGRAVRAVPGRQAGHADRRARVAAWPCQPWAISVAAVVPPRPPLGPPDRAAALLPPPAGRGSAAACRGARAPVAASRRAAGRARPDQRARSGDEAVLPCQPLP